jgi:hypothetical protein
MSKTQDIWALLEQDAPEGCEAVQALYGWSLNYDAGRGPFALFLDLTGWSDEHYGENVYQGTYASGLGYVELDKLAKALTEYAARPLTVSAHVDALMDAESATS